ncbi:MAG: hypothetical protein ABEJ91_00545 [Candidatus Nanohaloarchaea archaeon]
MAGQLTSDRLRMELSKVEKGIDELRQSAGEGLVGGSLEQMENQVEKIKRQLPAAEKGDVPIKPEQAAQIEEEVDVIRREVSQLDKNFPDTETIEALAEEVRGIEKVLDRIGG